MSERPAPSEYAPFYAGYVSLVPESDMLEALERQPAQIRTFATTIPKDRESFRYEPHKWSVKQVFGHMSDTERILGVRAFRFSRGDDTPLPGFDENVYVAAADSDSRTLADLVDEFVAVREANLQVFRRLDANAWRRTGLANSSAVSVRALAFILVGHARHHLEVLRSRYHVGTGS